MNVQQLRYVVAVANNGSFREAAKKLFVSQPTLSYAIKELESELSITLFDRTNKGTQLTHEGEDFFDYAQELLGQFERLEQRYMSPKDKAQELSIASQHYDFLSIVLGKIIAQHPQHRQFRLFESTTLNVIKDVEEYRSEVGIIFFNNSNQTALTRALDSGNLVAEKLTNFHTHIFIGQQHPLAHEKEINVADLAGYPQVRFTQETSNYTYFAEDLIEPPDLQQVILMSDRASLTGILQQTNAYGSGSGLVEDPNQQGIVLIPVADSEVSQLVLLRRKNQELSPIATEFVAGLKDYFQGFHKE